MYTVCIVDDEKDLLDLLEKYLSKEGYRVWPFSSGETALEAVCEDVHLWLLDIMLSGDVNGYDLIQEIRRRSDVPVIFMSARNQELDRIMGLELGGDDYLTKPFSPRELVLRVNNVIRRVYQTRTNDAKGCVGYQIDAGKRLVTKAGVIIDLTSKEMDLILLLSANPNQPFTRDQLLNRIWGNEYFGSDRVVDDLIKRVRKKLPNFTIETIYGYGYRFKS